MSAATELVASNRARYSLLAWQFHTDLALAGMMLAPETQTLLAWDAGHALYHLGRDGELLGRWPSQEAIHAAAISADGEWAVAVSTEGKLHWFSMSTDESYVLQGPDSPLGLACDSSCWHVAVANSRGENLIVDRFGRRLAGFRSERPFKFLAFPLERAALIAAAEHGLVAAYTLYGRQLWKGQTRTNHTALTVKSSGSMIVLSGLAQGLVRVGGSGKNLGPWPSEQISKTINLSAEGDLLLTGTHEHQALLLARSREVLWTEQFPTPILSVQLEPFARAAWVGLESGWIYRLDLTTEPSADAPAAEEAAPFHVARIPAPPQIEADAAEPELEDFATGGLIEPTWIVRLGLPVEQTGVVNVVVMESPPLIVLTLPNRSLAVYEIGAEAPEKPIHMTRPMEGTGRTMFHTEGLCIAVSDRRVMVYDAATNSSRMAPGKFALVTHARLIDRERLLLVQERDRVSLATLEGEELWVEQLRSSVQHLAVVPGAISVATDDGDLHFFNLEGRRLMQRASPRAGLMLLAAFPQSFLAVCETDHMARAYSGQGELLWEVRLAIEPWAILTAGPYCLIRDAFGRTLAIDEAGNVRPGRQPHVSDEWYFVLPDGRLSRIFQQPGNLCCTDYLGRLLWRYPCGVQDAVAAASASTAGIAAIVGSRLCWFAYGEDEISEIA